MAQVAQGLVTIRYRFQGETKFITVQVTETQYQNMLELPIIEKCEIVKV